MFVIGTGIACAQDKKLQIGDPAPPLKYAKWLQGPKPLTQLDKNKIYVIEFWATWCGPCIQAMPHLSELSKKYAGKIDFIGCDVWENKYGGPKDQQYYMPKVSRFVQDQYKLGRLTYNVIMDNTAEDMGNQWLKAAGIEGIPSSFVIEKGRIAWIGHPHYLDSILVAVIAGKYDVQAEKARQAKQAKRNEQMSAGYNAAIKAYKDAEAAKDYDKALQLIDAAIARFPANSYMFTTDRFMLLLQHYGEEKAIAYGRELQKEKLPGQVLIANLYTKSDLSQKVNEFGAEAVRGWAGANAKVLDIQATFEARAGHYKEAAETQKRAVEKAKAEKDNPAMTEGVISDMEKKIEEYQQKADAANTTSKAQEKWSKLMIGDKAPELRYGAWIKGTPIKTYEKDRLYLFEFWATWCGPCIASMPHLSEFAREHKETATVIAVNIWEGSHGENDKAYDSFLPKVSRFVSNMKNKMDFDVIMDNNDQHMGNQWMKAAGQGGIPCTFIVKNGIIQWIGHPVELDSVVSVVADKNYDVLAARAAFLEKSRKSDSASDGFSRVYKAYEAAIAEKQYNKAIAILDEGIAAEPKMAGTLGFFKFQTLLEHVGEAQAMAFAKPWQATKPGYVGSTGAVILNKKGLSKETYEYGIELAKTLLETPQPPSLVYKMIATGYANMGDYKTAVQMQQKAVDAGKQALKEEKFAGFVTPDTVAEDEKTLADYKKNLESSGG